MHPKNAGVWSVREFNRREIESTGTTNSYKCAGNEVSKTSIANISQAVSDESYSFLNRHYSSLVLSCENLGNQKQGSNRINKTNLEVSTTPLDHSYCRISSRLHERGDILSVKKLKGPFRVETPSINI